MRIIIDGYNLIFHCGFNGVTSTPAAITNSRRRLLDFLWEQLDISQRRQVTVVFDAKKLPRGESQLDSHKQDMRVIFSAGYDDADTLIVDLIRQHSHPKNLTVVTNDHRIQVAAKRRKAIAMDCEDWLNRIQQSPSVVAPEETKPGAGMENATQEWIEIFSEEASRKQAESPHKDSSQEDHAIKDKQRDSIDDGEFQNEMSDLDDELDSLIQESEREED